MGHVAYVDALLASVDIDQQRSRRIDIGRPTVNDVAANRDANVLADRHAPQPISIGEVFGAAGLHVRKFFVESSNQVSG